MSSSLHLLRLATSAGQRAAGWLRTAGQDLRGADWEAKGHNDWVSQTDRTAEAMIAADLLAGESGSRIVGEELTPDLGQGGKGGPGLWRGVVWIVDPLDGTTNFLHGYPQYAVSIAAAVDGVLEAGVVVDVTREVCYTATRGGGAWEGGRRLSVSRVTDPTRALLGTGFPFKHLDRLDEYLEQLRRLVPLTSGIRRAGAAALDLADLAAGRFDGFWELRLASWDIAAGMLLAREAGGVVTDLDGRDVGLEHTAVVAGNPAIHGWLVRALRPPSSESGGPPP